MLANSFAPYPILFKCIDSIEWRRQNKHLELFPLLENNLQLFSEPTMSITLPERYYRCNSHWLFLSHILFPHYQFQVEHFSVHEIKRVYIHPANYNK